MGINKEITHNTFPAQATRSTEVNVCFHYDTTHTVRGTVVREDLDSPVMIIRLVDGRHVLSTECQYSYVSAKELAEERAYLPESFWDELEERFNYVAIDKNGEAYAFVMEPSVQEDTYWYSKHKEDYTQVFSHEGLYNGDWKDSLRKRGEF